MKYSLETTKYPMGERVSGVRGVWLRAGHTDLWTDCLSVRWPPLIPSALAGEGQGVMWYKTWLPIVYIRSPRTLVVFPCLGPQRILESGGVGGRGGEGGLVPLSSPVVTETLEELWGWDHVWKDGCLGSTGLKSRVGRRCRFWGIVGSGKGLSCASPELLI